MRSGNPIDRARVFAWAFALSLAALLLVAIARADTVWRVQLPTYMPETDSGGIVVDPCATVPSPVRDSLRELRLYVADRWATVTPLYRLTETLPAVPGSTIDVVLDDSPPGRTYALAVVDSHGLESCWRYRTVGIPLVSVPVLHGETRRPARLYDVAGRRVEPGTKLRPGIYFTDPKRRRPVLVLEGGKPWE